MQPDLCFPIDADTALCEIVRAKGFFRFEQLAEHVRSLPYSRVSCGTDLTAVLFEAHGTCSSKHRLLAAIAHDCGRHDIRLTVGIYLMSGANTPGVATALQSARLAEIPEAHCYLSVGAERADFTGLPFGTESPFATLVAEKDVAPADLPEVKASWHRAYVDSWAKARGLDAQVIWAMRESCIAALAACVGGHRGEPRF
jgi:hypothetical protein